MHMVLLLIYIKWWLSKLGTFPKLQNTIIIYLSPGAPTCDDYWGGLPGVWSIKLQRCQFPPSPQRGWKWNCHPKPQNSNSSLNDHDKVKS